jgi:hypothetical protein
VEITQKYMEKYKTKPVEIEAIEWDETEETFEILKKNGMDYGHYNSHVEEKYIRNLGIVTLEGTMEAKKGDFIIKGLRGEFYPCKPDVFHMKYELSINNPGESQKMI